MALVECRFRSALLRRTTAVHVVLPERAAPPARGYPWLVLLHGLGDDHAAWVRNTNIERYAETAGLAVVMPDVGRSYCVDMAHGLPYFRYLVEELPETMARFFRLSSERRDRSAGGVSMGGYGALRLGLLRSRDYANVVTISAVADFRGGVELIRKGAMDFLMPPSEALAVVGAGFEVQNEMDVFHLLRHHDGEALPRFFQACGTKDFLHAENVRLRDALLKAGAEAHFDESDTGHEWEYWDDAIRRAIAWLATVQSRGSVGPSGDGFVTGGSASVSSDQGGCSSTSEA